MSVEPGIVDTNVLVYAVNADALQHAAARALIDTARDGSSTLYVSSQILCEFFSTVTNPKRVAHPRTPAEALDALSDLLSFLHVLPIPAQTVDGWMQLLRERPVIGGNVFDLQIAATMKVNDITRIYTFNVDDFEPIPGLAVVVP